MGNTFENPTYFYGGGAPPDLVDTNGPIYARTSVNVGNVTPKSVTMTSGSDIISASEFVTHDLRMVAHPQSPASSGETATISAGLSGYVEPNWGTDNKTFNVNTTYNFMFAVEFFDTDATISSPIVVALGDEYGQVYGIGCGMLFPEQGNAVQASVHVHNLVDSATVTRIYFYC